MFRITDPKEIETTNKEILAILLEEEILHKRRRASCKQPVMGAERLRNEGIIENYVPKKKDRKPFVLSSIKRVRIGYIHFMDALEARCRELYKQMCQGVKNLEWPPGVFIPACPPLYSAIRG